MVITDAIPVGANYVSGGTLMPGNIVSWTVPSVAINGGTVDVTFTVTAAQGIFNAHYRVTCAEGISATGKETVYTNWRKYYLPVIMKAR